MTTRARQPGRNPIADGHYRVVTGEGDYFVTVFRSAVTIQTAIGLDGESTDWNQEDYARIFGAIGKPYAWLEVDSFEGASA